MNKKIFLLILSLLLLNLLFSLAYASSNSCLNIKLTPVFNGESRTCSNLNYIRIIDLDCRNKPRGSCWENFNEVKINLPSNLISLDGDSRLLEGRFSLLDWRVACNEGDLSLIKVTIDSCEYSLKINFEPERNNVGINSEEKLITLNNEKSGSYKDISSSEQNFVDNEESDSEKRVEEKHPLKLKNISFRGSFLGSGITNSSVKSSSLNDVEVVEQSDSEEVFVGSNIRKTGSVRRHNSNSKKSSFNGNVHNNNKYINNSWNKDNSKQNISVKKMSKFNQKSVKHIEDTSNKIKKTTLSNKNLNKDGNHTNSSKQITIENLYDYEFKEKPVRTPFHFLSSIKYFLMNFFK